MVDICTLKALFIADNTVSNYYLTHLIIRVVYCQFWKARLAHTQSKRVLRLFTFYLLTLGPPCGMLVVWRLFFGMQSEE